MLYPRALHDTHGVFQGLRGFDLRRTSIHSEEGRDREDIPCQDIGIVARQNSYRVKKIVFA